MHSTSTTAPTPSWITSLDANGFTVGVRSTGERTRPHLSLRRMERSARSDGCRQLHRQQPGQPRHHRRGIPARVGRGEEHGWRRCRAAFRFAGCGHRLDVVLHGQQREYQPHPAAAARRLPGRHGQRRQQQRQDLHVHGVPAGDGAHHLERTRPEHGRGHANRRPRVYRRRCGDRRRFAPGGRELLQPGPGARFEHRARWHGRGPHGDHHARAEPVRYGHHHAARERRIRHRDRHVRADSQSPQ